MNHLLLLVICPGSQTSVLMIFLFLHQSCPRRGCSVPACPCCDSQHPPGLHEAPHKHHAPHPALVNILKITLRLPLLSALSSRVFLPLYSWNLSYRYSPSTSRCPPATQQLPGTRSLKFKIIQPLAKSEEYTRENHIYNFTCLGSTPKEILSPLFFLCTVSLPELPTMSHTVNENLHSARSLC